MSLISVPQVLWSPTLPLLVRCMLEPDYPPFLTTISDVHYLPSLFPQLKSHFPQLQDVDEDKCLAYMTVVGDRRPLPWHHPAGALLRYAGAKRTGGGRGRGGSSSSSSSSSGSAGVDVMCRVQWMSHCEVHEIDLYVVRDMNNVTATSVLPLHRPMVMRKVFMSQWKESCQCMFGSSQPVMTMSNQLVERMVGAVVEMGAGSDSSKAVGSGAIVGLSPGFEQYAEVRSELFEKEIVGCLVRIHDFSAWENVRMGILDMDYSSGVKAFVPPPKLRKLARHHMNQTVKQALFSSEPNSNPFGYPVERVKCFAWGAEIDIERVSIDDLLSYMAAADLSIHLAVAQVAHASG